MATDPEDRAHAAVAAVAGHASRSALVRAFLVHLLTASGAALGLLALVAAVDGRWSVMCAWFGLALIVDGIDGTFARRLKVAERLPRWSGETLDLVVDFVTYSFVPAYAIAASGLLPGSVALPAGVVIVMTSGLYFADRRMKMAGNYFRGFPALWNIAAFYLLLLRLDPWVNAAVVAALAALSFAPFRFIHPLRVRRWRAANVVLLVVWSVLGIVALDHDLAPGPLVSAGLVAIGLYVLGAGLLPGRSMTVGRYR
jgi:phosphatidylcholine synthase